MVHVRFDWSPRMSPPLPTLLVLALAFLPLSAAEGSSLFFSENFNTTTMSGDLTAPAGWTSGTDSSPADVAQNNSGFRTYVSTVATNYNTVDFVYEISFTVAGGGGGGIAYVGIGSGLPDGGFYDEPSTAFYLRQSPSDFGNGFTGTTIGLPDGTHNESTIADPGPGDGTTYRAQIQKLGNLVTIGLDTNYTTGPFLATYSVTKDLLTDLSFLDSTNTRLFFGTEISSTTFDDLSITGSVPEIDPAGMGAVLALVTGALGLLERRSRPAP